MSIIQKELKAQIRRKKRELSQLWEKVSELMKTKEVADLKEFVSLMQQEPVLTEYISSDLAEVEGITAKKLRKKAILFGKIFMPMECYRLTASHRPKQPLIWHETKSANVKLN